MTNVALCRWAAFAPISPLLWSKSPSVSRLRYAPTACLLHFPPVSPYLTYVLFCSVHALDPKVYSERPLFSRNSRFPPPRNSYGRVCPAQCSLLAPSCVCTLTGVRLESAQWASLPSARDMSFKSHPPHLSDVSSHVIFPHDSVSNYLVLRHSPCIPALKLRPMPPGFI